MTTATASPEQPEAPLFSDGLGPRLVAADAATGELLQILRIRQALTAVPSFEFALRERTARLANFRHAYYARVRRVDRVQLPAPGLAIMSDHVEGTRLSEILRVAHERRLPLDINSALCLIRQLVPAVALLHENARDVAHGLLAPERLIVTPHARLVIVEHVLAAAIEQLQYSREQLWQEFQIAVPPSAGLPRFDHRADVTGIGLVALALVLGRPIAADEFPSRVPSLLNETRERITPASDQPLSAPFRDWLARALQLEARRAFASAPEALAALDELVADDSMYMAAPVALETFLSRYIAAVLEPPPIAEAAPAPPSVAEAAPGLPTVRLASAKPDTISEIARAVEQDVGTHTLTAAPAPTATAIIPVESVPVDVESVEDVPVEEEIASEPSFADLDAALFPDLDSAFANLESETDVTTGHQPTASRGTESAPPTIEPAEPLVAHATEPAVIRDTMRPVTTESPVSREIRASVPPIPEIRATPQLPFSFPPDPRAARKPTRGLRWAGIAALVIVVGGGGLFAARHFRGGEDVITPGTLIVQSNPEGVQVFIDGIDYGTTPTRVSVSPGAHILELRGRGAPRVIPFTVAEGAEISHHLEFASTPETGGLRIESQPPGAKVLVDGVERGSAPLTVDDLTPGDHEVVLQSAGGSVRHVVQVQAGGIASLVAPVAAAASGGPVSGWLSVKAPFSMEIHEDGRVIGSTDVDRLMMAAGRREIQLVNAALGYRVSRVVQVQPGRVSTLTVDLPNGVVNFNATPWAEVWIDGQRVGETPIGNLSVPIGSHEVVFRHPQLGEKRHAISVTVGVPVRLSVEMK